jgi:hypothetical protein
MSLAGHSGVKPRRHYNRDVRAVEAMFYNFSEFILDLCEFSSVRLTLSAFDLVTPPHSFLSKSARLILFLA